MPYILQHLPQPGTRTPAHSSESRKLNHWAGSEPLNTGFSMNGTEKTIPKDQFYQEELLYQRKRELRPKRSG